MDHENRPLELVGGLSVPEIRSPVRATSRANRPTPSAINLSPASQVDDVTDHDVLGLALVHALSWRAGAPERPVGPRAGVDDLGGRLRAYYGSEASRQPHDAGQAQRASS